MGRSLFAAALLFAMFPGARRRPPRATWWVCTAYAVTVTLFVAATKLTTAANAIFLQDTAPLWVLLLSPMILRERPGRAELLSVPVYGIEVVLFFADQLVPGQLDGNLIATASGISFALCVIGLRYVRDGQEGIMAWGNVLAVALALPFAVQGSAPIIHDLGIVAFLGVFQLGLAYAAFGRGIRQVSAVEASLLVLAEPIFNTILTFLIVGERPGRYAIIGGVFVLAAAAWRTLGAPAPSMARAESDAS